MKLCKVNSIAIATAVVGLMSIMNVSQAAMGCGAHEYFDMKEHRCVVNHGCNPRGAAIVRHWDPETQQCVERR